MGKDCLAGESVQPVIPVNPVKPVQPTVIPVDPVELVQPTVIPVDAVEPPTHLSTRKPNRGGKHSGIEEGDVMIND